MYYLLKHIDANVDGEVQGMTDVVWQYDDESDALDAADMYNSNLQLAGIPSWVCCYSVSS